VEHLWEGVIVGQEMNEVGSLSDTQVPAGTLTPELIHEIWQRRFPGVVFSTTIN